MLHKEASPFVCFEVASSLFHLVAHILVWESTEINTSRYAFSRVVKDFVDSYHRIMGWKRPLRSSSPTIHPTPPCLLNHIPKCHGYTFWTPPGMGNQPPFWASCSNASPLFQ